MDKLNFIIPIFNQKVKVRVGNINKIIKKYDINILSPVMAFYDVRDGCHFIALPKDWEKYLSHECGHCAWGIVRTIESKIKDSEELIMYLQDYLIDYIKENL
jgi:hypothetical protein